MEGHYGDWNFNRHDVQCECCRGRHRVVARRRTTGTETGTPKRAGPSDRVSGRAGARRKHLGALGGAEPGQAVVGRASGVLQGVLWADVALCDGPGHRRGEEAAVGGRSPVLPVRTDPRLRRQVLHRHAFQTHMEYGSICLRPGDPHAGGTRRDRARARRRGASTRAGTGRANLRHGNSGQSSWAVYLRPEIGPGRQGLRRGGSPPSQRRLEPLSNGRG